MYNGKYELGKLRLLRMNLINTTHKHISVLGAKRGNSNNEARKKTYIENTRNYCAEGW